MSKPRPAPQEETFPLKLTAKELPFLLDHQAGLDLETITSLQAKQSKQGLQLTFDQLEDLAFHVTSLVAGEKSAAVKKMLDGIFRKVSDAMRVAAAAEEGADDLKGVLSLQKARDLKATAAEAKATRGMIGSFMADAQDTGFAQKRFAALQLPPDARAAIVASVPLDEKLRARLGDPGYRMTVRDGLEMVAAVTEMLAADPSEESAELLRRLQEVEVDTSEDLELGPRSRRRKRKATAQVYQLKITLLGSKPRIWRRFQLKDGTLAELHGAIQAVMGWDNSHLHQFDIDDQRYMEPSPDGDDELDALDERHFLLSDVLEEKFKFGYTYDFGDSWDHDVVVEKVLKPEKSVKYPVCLAGERACPPEDVGGVGGYEDFLAAIRDPKHPEHDHYMEWMGEGFDAAAFDLAAVNRALRGGR